MPTQTRRRSAADTVEPATSTQDILQEPQAQATDPFETDAQKRQADLTTKVIVENTTSHVIAINILDPAVEGNKPN